MQNAVYAMNPSKLSEPDPSESLDQNDLLMYLQKKYKTPEEIARRGLIKRKAQKILGGIKLKSSIKENKHFKFEDLP